MNKQAAKLAKTTALLNSTSIQLRISGLCDPLSPQTLAIRIRKRYLFPLEPHSLFE